MTAKSSPVEAAASQPAARHADFEIPATASIYDQRPRTLKHGESFAVFDDSGDVVGFSGDVEGLYHRDTRHLSQYYLTIENGIRPILLSSNVRDDNSVFTCDLTNPDVARLENGRPFPNDLLHVGRTRFLFEGKLYERLTFTNYGEERLSSWITLHFDCDFSDLFEVRGATRLRRGTMLPPETGHNFATLSYRGLDGKTRRTRLEFAPAPQELSAREAMFRLALEPRRSFAILVEIACNPDPSDAALPLRHRMVRAFRETRNALRRHASRAAAISSSNEVFNRSIRRCIADTYMLITDTEHGPFPYAGIPWYSTVFGRDALITAWQTLWLDPLIARGVLRHLAARQATDFDPAADAEPGKILHEVRHGEMANLGEVPFGCYYGSIDSTPLFVMLAGAYLDRTDDWETIEGLWPNIAAALQWIAVHGDRDGDGYVEYGRRREGGLLNQGWKDSHDSVFHADGRLAAGPIALAEVQAYTYGAWCCAARILERRGDALEAAAYAARAERLRERFDADFFDEELGIYVLALDGDKRPCRVRSSNAGQVLLTGLALPERVPRLVAALMDRQFFSGWGIRTIHAAEARYNPMSYHNGSIWPHDNALIGAGFSRYGYRTEVVRILEGLFTASTYVDLRRLPELFCGFVRRPANGPTLYPVSCIPQAWAAVAQLSLLQSCLGLTLDAANRMIQFEQPLLPDFVNELFLRKLAIGEDWVDLRLCRSGDKVLLEVLEQKGNLRTLVCV